MEMMAVWLVHQTDFSLTRWATIRSSISVLNGVNQINVTSKVHSFLRVKLLSPIFNICSKIFFIKTDTYKVLIVFCVLKQVLSSLLCYQPDNANTEQMLLLRLTQSWRHHQRRAWCGNDWRLLFVNLLCVIYNDNGGNTNTCRQVATKCWPAVASQ